MPTFAALITRRARKDARHEAARRTRALNRMAGPAPGPRDDMRQPGRLLLDIGRTVIDLELRPDPRDVRRWLAYRNGRPYCHAGLEGIWRTVQREVTPAMGRRHWQ
jgi:hypothetical protein